MKPEDRARQKIDALLEQAGWVVQDRNRMNLDATLGVAVREFPLPSGAADYLLFIDFEPVGIVEAKKIGHALIGVEQHAQYAAQPHTKLHNHVRPGATVPYSAQYDEALTATQLAVSSIRDCQDQDGIAEEGVNQADQLIDK